MTHTWDLWKWPSIPSILLAFRQPLTASQGWFATNNIMLLYLMDEAFLSLFNSRAGTETRSLMVPWDGLILSRLTSVHTRHKDAGAHSSHLSRVLINLFREMLFESKRPRSQPFYFLHEIIGKLLLFPSWHWICFFWMLNLKPVTNKLAFTEVSPLKPGFTMADSRWCLLWFFQ